MIAPVPELTANDGTTLAYCVAGSGTCVVCLAGGPMLDSGYLGDLGGLSQHVQLVLPDYRGTGRSQKPTDGASYRCDRLVDDVEALREHLKVDRMVLLGHSAGANVAALYAVRRPERISRLLLVTPSTRAVGIATTSADRCEVIRLHEGEEWFPAASSAFEAIAAGNGTEHDWESVTPFSYGRWDDAARAHHVSAERHRNEEAAVAFGAEGAFNPEQTRAALARFDAPVFVLVGERDMSAPPQVVAELAALFPNATLVTQPGAGHYPWLDDPTWFTQAITANLA
jgi:proline iminopeptidase